MTLIFRSNPQEVKVGEVLLLRDAVGQMAMVPDQTVYRCECCTMNGPEDPCTRHKLWQVCRVHGFFLPIEHSEEVDRARDLFALKGELL